MTEVADRYARIADGFTARLTGVPAEGWTVASPCTEWSAREVAVHVLNTHRMVLASVGPGEVEEFEPDEDLIIAWGDATAAIRASLGDPDRAAATTVRGPFAEQPFESLVGRLLCTDTLIHTWDLARATGQDESLDPEGVAKASEFLIPIDDAIRRPGGFAPKITPAPGADAQSELLNFCGRATSG